MFADLSGFDGGSHSGYATTHHQGVGTNLAFDRFEFSHNSLLALSVQPEPDSDDSSFQTLKRL
jgi:hypothetical protein